MRKFGRELKVGDTIKVWWSSYQNQVPNEDTIAKLLPYDDKSRIYRNGARIAYFVHNRKVGMTIANDSIYDVVISKRQAKST